MSQDAESSSRRKGGAPIFAILLIAAGILLLLQTTGVLPWEIWSGIWRLWPVVVIAIGINLIFGNRLPWLAGLLIAAVVVAAILIALIFIPVNVTSSVTVSSFEEPLQGVETVEVEIDFGAGELSLLSLPEGSTNLVEGKFRGRGAETFIERSGNTAELNINSESPGESFFRNLSDLDINVENGGVNIRSITDTEWEVFLAQEPNLDLNIDGGAADINLDLRDLHVTSLNIDTGASDLEVRMPANAGHVDAEIDAGAANVVVHIPEGVAARIESDVAIGSMSVSRSRFPENGDFYMSPDFDSATNRVDLRVDAGASNVEIR